MAHTCGRLATENDKRYFSFKIWTLSPLYLSHISHDGVSGYMLIGRSSVYCSFELVCLLSSLDELEFLQYFISNEHFSGIMRPAGEAGQSPPSIAEGQTEWAFMPAALCPFTQVHYPLWLIKNSVEKSANYIYQ